MDIEVYCDESRPELFASKKQTTDRYMLIGSIWFPKESRAQLKQKLKKIRIAHNVFGEIKWNKVSPTKLDFYKDIVSFFFDENDTLRFRCIIIDSKEVDLKKYHKGDAELGFYKFYYQLLHHWIKEGNQYAIFTDTKTTRFRNRLNELHSILNKANIFAKIINLQAIPSKESIFIQLADLLTGALGYSCHGLNTNKAKNEIIALMAERLNRKPDTSTSRDTPKFNVFRIRLNEGNW